MADETPLEPSVKKLLDDRMVVLKSSLQAEGVQQVEREKAAKEGREKIAAMENEIAEIEAFLTRH